jgi:hypothetical protein
MTTTLTERELEFTFPSGWNARVFDEKGKQWPKGISPVDFIVERERDILLIEIKDPSASRAPAEEREKFVKKMTSDELCHQELVPKARTTHGYLHLMGLDTKPMRYVVVIGAEHLSLQPVLMQSLADRVKKRLLHEAEAPWQLRYIESCVVLSATDVGKHLAGVKVRRLSNA